MSNNIVCVVKMSFFILDKKGMKGVCHIRPPLSHPSPHYPRSLKCELFFISYMSKLVDYIVLNLLCAYIYKKNIPGHLEVHVFIKITQF